MVILAAGASSRMGYPKQLLPWKETTLLGYAIEQGVNSNADSIFVVLGANFKSITDKIDNHKITIIENSNWSLGMGSSIACAMEYIKRKNIHFNAILFTLVDQPLIEFNHFNILINSFLINNNNIIATQIKSRAGVPAIFGLSYFKALSNLNKDIGAKEIIAANMNDVLMVKTENLNVDIDTKISYKILYDKYGK